MRKASRTHTPEQPMGMSFFIYMFRGRSNGLIVSFFAHTARPVEPRKREGESL